VKVEPENFEEDFDSDESSSAEGYYYDEDEDMLDEF